jgi:hypothetical protein
MPGIESFGKPKPRSAAHAAHVALQIHQLIVVDAWPAPGSEDTELGVLMELEVGHGETEVYARVQA